MFRSILIVGGTKVARLEKAWGLLLDQGFSKGKESVDLLLLKKEESKKSLGIAEARNIKTFLSEKPLEKKIKAVLVEDAQFLTDEAQNSLLKILEEPPIYAIIILLADKEGSLLPTVVSRCQRIYVRESSNPQSLSVDSPYDLSKEPVEKLFDLANEISEKNRDEVIEFLEKVLNTDMKLGCPVTLVHKMEDAIKDIKEANVSLKFALEYLFLLHYLYFSHVNSKSLMENRCECVSM